MSATTIIRSLPRTGRRIQTKVCSSMPAQEYASNRRNAQEAAYNLGRAAHRLGLLHVAAPLHWNRVKSRVCAQEYASKRRNAQEAAYKLARAAHQLGLLHGAAPLH